jgi:SAM-dependent methyltransferase
VSPTTSAHGARYTREYFDRWYRDPRRRVLDAAEIARRARLVVSVAEYLIERPVRSVLDVGCGEGNWRAPLRALRPRLHYLGIDPSDYAIARFGRRRNLRKGSAETLDALELRSRYDVVIASGVLNFLAPAALRRALGAIHDVLEGVAFLELFATSDDVVGDTRGWKRRSPRASREALRQAGFVACGPHCYVTSERAKTLAALETR